MTAYEERLTKLILQDEAYKHIRKHLQVYINAHQVDHYVTSLDNLIEDGQTKLWDTYFQTSIDAITSADIEKYPARDTYIDRTALIQHMKELILKEQAPLEAGYVTIVPFCCQTEGSRKVLALVLQDNCPKETPPRQAAVLRLQDCIDRSYPSQNDINVEQESVTFLPFETFVNDNLSSVLRLIETENEQAANLLQEVPTITDKLAIKKTAIYAVAKSVLTSPRFRTGMLSLNGTFYSVFEEEGKTMTALFHNI